jgi:hypothetical protein
VKNVQNRSGSGMSDEGDDRVTPTAPNIGGVAMNNILSALLLLSVVAGVAAPASALDAKSFFDQQDRTKY